MFEMFRPIREIDFAVRYGGLGGHPGHLLENTRNMVNKE